jgi:hypothetical protein
MILNHFGWKSFILRMTGQFNLTSYDRPIVENDKIRQLGRDKFCAGRVGEIPRDGISVMLTGQWTVVSGPWSESTRHWPLTTDH